MFCFKAKTQPCLKRGFRFVSAGSAINNVWGMDQSALQTGRAPTTDGRVGLFKGLSV